MVGSAGMIHQTCPGTRMSSRNDGHGGFGRSAVAGVNASDRGSGTVVDHDGQIPHTTSAFRQGRQSGTPVIVQPLFAIVATAADSNNVIAGSQSRRVRRSYTLVPNPTTSRRFLYSNPADSCTARSGIKAATIQKDTYRGES